MFSLQAIGINSFMIANKKFIKNLRNQKIFEEMLDKIVEKAKENCPVDTGAAEKAIKWIKQGANKYALVCDVPHAIYIEYGTRYFPVPEDVTSPRGYKSTSGKMASVPFLRSAIWDVQRQFPKMMSREIDVMYMNK